MKKNKNERIKLIALILVLCITLGYAALRTGLNINGTTNVSSASWNVYFSNYQMSNATNITPTEEPEIVGTTTTSISYEVDLDVPGDLYEFSVEVVNGGSLDALISLVSKYNGSEIGPSNPVPAYIEYVVSDGNGDPIVDGHRLNHGDRETVKVFVKYKEDASVLPSSDATLRFDIEIEATQAPALPTGDYTMNYYGVEPQIHIGEALPQGVRRYSTAERAMAAWNSIPGQTTRPVCLKHAFSDNIVTESYIEFVVTDDVVQQDREEYISANCNHYLMEDNEWAYNECVNEYVGMKAGTYRIRGAGASPTGETDIHGDIYGDSPYYESNIDVMKTAFGQQCTASSGERRAFCFNRWLSISLYSNGNVAVGTYQDYSCEIEKEGTSYCSDSGTGS